MTSGSPVPVHDWTNSGNILSIANLRTFSLFSTSCSVIIAPFFAAMQMSRAVQSNIAPLKLGIAAECVYFEIRQCLIPTGGFMDIIGALQQEESRLQRQLTAVRSAIVA